MIIFRPHCGGTISEGIKKAKEFNTESEMKQYVVDDWNAIINDLFDVNDVVINGESINDERIGWEDCRYVCIKRCGDRDYMKLYGVPQCVGYCATKYKRT